MAPKVDYAIPSHMDMVGSYPPCVDPMELEAELGTQTPYQALYCGLNVCTSNFGLAMWPRGAAQEQ